MFQSFKSRWSSILIFFKKLENVTKLCEAFCQPDLQKLNLLLKYNRLKFGIL